MFTSPNNELICIEDLFENDEYVLMKGIFMIDNRNITKTSVGIKEKNGDIGKIICVDMYENESRS